MALKYFLEFVDSQNGFWRIEIDSPTYTDEPIRIEGGENPLKIEYNGNSDDDIFKTHVIPSSATINAINTGIDLDEIFYINDASYKVRVYYGDTTIMTLKWQGYLISDGVQEIDSGVPYEVTLKAIDGLDVLDNVTFVWSNNYPSINVAGTNSAGRCPMNALRLALYASQNLDNDLPIKWNTSLKNDQYTASDMLAGLTRINPDGKLSLSKPDATVMWWVDNIMRSALSWCYQKNGYWYFTNYFDVFANSGNYNGWEITADTTNPQPATVYNDLELTPVLDTDTINENWFWFGKKPFGKVNVLYEDTKFPDNNAIPNGGFDTISTGVISDWFAKFGHATLSAEDLINGRDIGYSAEVMNVTDQQDYISFGRIPIDTSILFKTATIGFLWLPISGYDLTVDGNIDFSKFPLNISVKLEIGGVEYYLNEFGYWSDKSVQANAQVTQYDYNIGDSTFTVQFDPAKNFFPGDEVRIFFTRSGVDTGYFIKFDTTMSVSDGVNYISSQIPNTSSPNAYTVAVQGVTNNPSWQNAYTQKVRDYYKKIEFDFGNNLKPNDVVDVQFQSKGSAGDIKLPEGMGYLSFEIYSKPGSQMRLDDVYFRVQDAHDLYTVGINNSKNSEESYTMGISSGFSGNMPSSYGDNYSTVDESMYWNSGKTLTELYGRAVMDVRHKPCRVFSGSIDKMVDWGLFSLMGRTYAPLSMSLDCRNLITDIVGVEFNPSDGGYYVNHKSSEGAN